MILINIAVFLMQKEQKLGHNSHSSLMISNPFKGIKCINIQKSIKVTENMIRCLVLEIPCFHFSVGYS